ncbi:MAG: two pore domain potassium channel family protein [Gemmatimonadales bacterium]|nr:two pore domain potassium channel family protein [Gemmatimonadales bacterium]
MNHYRPINQTIRAMCRRIAGMFWYRVPNTHGEEIRRIVGDVEHFGQAMPDLAILRKMLDGIVRQQSQLLENARSVQEQQQTELTAQDCVADPLDKLRRVRSYQRECERLERLYAKIYGTMQEHIIRNRLIEGLGRRHHALLEITIFGLILFVVSLLCVELWYSYRYDMQLLATFLHPTELEAFDAHRKSVLVLFFGMDALSCWVFIREYMLRYRCADDKKWFVRYRWVDLVSSIPIPIILAPYWRVGRVFRVLRILRLLRIARLWLFVWRGMEKMERVVRVRMMKKSLAGLVVIIAVGTCAFEMVEPENGRLTASNPQAPSQVIQGTASLARPENMGDQAWWTFATVVTGGFADIYDPQAPFGRLLTAGLVLGGIIVVGVFTATLAAEFFGEQSEELMLRQDHLENYLQGLAGKGKGT